MTGFTTMPDSNFLTWRTCAAWASGSRLRWMTPRPPACAMAIAILASVTVSMAEAMIGILSEISRVIRVRISASDGSNSDNPGLSRTSSKVSASRRVPLDFWSIATPVTRLAGLVAGTVGSEIAPALRRNGSLARNSTTRFGLAPVVSTARRRILALRRQSTDRCCPACGVAPNAGQYRWGADRRRLC